MISSGIVRKLDKLGRIVIPMEFKRTLKISNGDSLEICMEGETVTLKKYEPTCYCCNNYSDRYEEIFGRDICPECFEKFKSAIETIDLIKK